jgi:hypothetical protein
LIKETEVKMMYYPLLRGRQNELLAIKELLNQSKLSDKIIPVIEPVKLSPTLVSTIEAFNNKNHDLIFIRNPKVGSFLAETKNQKNQKYHDRIRTLVDENNAIKNGVIIDSLIKDTLTDWNAKGIENSSIFALCLNPDAIMMYKNAVEGHSISTFVPDDSPFRRLNGPKILLADRFEKKQKNSEYLKIEDQFYSADHLYFLDEGYLGFGDYSIIGREYSESGFAPYAVALHIVYFDKNKELRIHHFVSDDNDDINDPANKFYQALEKLVQWNTFHKLNTYAMQEFEKIFKAETYPGLGFVKKLCVMHHLELIGNYLDGKL